MAELTDEQIAAENKFLEGLPRVNLGALFMPGIWGPVHGSWICILFYPLYLFVDNMLFAAYTRPDALSVALSVICVVLLLAVTVAFAIVQQPIAAHRAAEKGVNRQAYLRREKVWAVVCVVIAIAAIAWATYYNLNIRVA